MEEERKTQERRKVIMLRGLPGSGKSSHSKELLKSGGNYYRVNRDHIREMAYFSEYRGKREGMVIDLEKSIVKQLLVEHKSNVIIDDCNLGDQHLSMWREFLVKIAAENNMQITLEPRWVDTPMEECIKRDATRERTVGRSTIVGMAMRYGLYKPKSVVLCDLDGTIANLDHRLPYMYPTDGGKKDWKSFFAEISNDSLIEEVAAQLRQKRMEGHEIFFISARPDNYREATEEWLARVGAPPYTALFMRRAMDKREDSEIKQDLLDQYFPDKTIINAVYDDRSRVIRMWQENGLNVIDCGSGVEF